MQWASDRPEKRPVFWQEALRRQPITESGCWTYLSWNEKDRQTQVMSKTPISMTSMQSLLEELVERIQDQAH